MNTSISDWAYLKKFQFQNEVLKKQFDQNRIVFIGDSIIAGWNKSPMFIENSHFINRGINGQTTDQVLHRFPYDVIALRPEYVVILVGTNDVAENRGSITIDEINSNFSSMIDLATTNKVKVILCSILPVTEYYWNKKIMNFEKISSLNHVLSSLSNNLDVFYLDFHTSFLLDGAINTKFSDDGVHPNKVGFSVMSTIFMQYLPYIK